MFWVLAVRLARQPYLRCAPLLESSESRVVSSDVNDSNILYSPLRLLGTFDEQRILGCGEMNSLALCPHRGPPIGLRDA